MTLFGQTLDSQQLFAFVSMLAVLLLWMVTLRGDRRQSRWLRGWEDRRKARRDAARTGDATAPEDRRGPWG